MTSDHEGQPVLVDVQEGIGRLTLNRPRAINALTFDMLRIVDEALLAWAADPDVRLVLLAGSGERGLCAGADLRAMSASAQANDGQAREFFRTEYRVNARVARFPKPFVALMDGIVMGGGIGLAGHADVRVVTERSVVAMPEVGIGLVPDVGGTYLLSRSPGATGTHLALTGTSTGAGGAMAAGLADHFVPSGRLPDLVALLAERPVAEAVAAVAAPAPVSELEGQQWLEPCYSHDTVEEVLAALRAANDPAAGAAADVIDTRSPTALKVTLESLRRAAGMPLLEQVLEQEFRVSCSCLATHDLVEGIRAQVIDKDRTPRWAPASLGEITSADVDGFFRDRGYGSVGLTPLEAVSG